MNVFAVEPELRKRHSSGIRIDVVVAVDLHDVVYFRPSARQRREYVPVFDRIEVLRSIRVRIFGAGHRKVVTCDHVHVIAISFTLPDIAEPVHEIKLERSTVPDPVITVQNNVVRIKLARIIRIKDNLAVLIRIRKVRQQNFLIRISCATENAEPVV